MRKIEQNMLSAIREGRNWMEANTQVTFHESDRNAGLCSVFLHGNRIALVDRTFTEGQTGRATAVHSTFAEWPTSTTVSRLRALGVNASVKGGKPMIDGVAI